ncbi:Exodeoxyribonuclease 7 large subunit [Stieleria bergensis]|uniref:Exodeoxyribonuclease 7 large subunit n=1 Tax=Stieleria bergensis TaxID=2528025 RepID=A0A517SU62_9BACT|nr:Exodeoxyribonuclease 7 large subunit [Planctomycetes bacterium SV_7m_r]
MDDILLDNESAMHDARPLTVSEVNQQLKMVVEETFPPLWMVGEVTDLVRARSGHIYFSLKDDQSQVRAVIWRSAAAKIDFDLQNGQSVLCRGALEVYTVRGTYQIVVRKIQPQGLGTLQQAFEQLKKRLTAEGLFDESRKKLLPDHPKRVAVITSPSGAAVHDFLVTAVNRMLDAEIMVIPAQVQGKPAAASIRKAFKAVQIMSPQPDVVVLTRGGGSLEDLWCFNEEAVVRAIAQCDVPTVSAVGHEVDVTLSDFAADLRALTPTDAAVKVFADRSNHRQQVQELQQRLHRAMRLQVQSRYNRLEQLANHPALAKPLEIVHWRAQLIDDLDSRLQMAIKRQLQTSAQQIAALSAQLQALSPLNTLSRGYSVTTDPDGQVLANADSVKLGDEIVTRLASGKVWSHVTDVQPEQEAS